MSILTREQIEDRKRLRVDDPNRLVIRPDFRTKSSRDSNPDADDSSRDSIPDAGAASIDLRLGCWFTTMCVSSLPALTIEYFDAENGKRHDPPMVENHYVPFGRSFILHPNHFALAITLEWVCLPANLAAYVVGKSSWGRRGLIIATAVGVHPSFCGCITLEITNLGEVPVELRPGMEVCQIFFHNVNIAQRLPKPESRFSIQRKPQLGEVKIDDFARKLNQIKY